MKRQAASCQKYRISCGRRWCGSCASCCMLWFLCCPGFYAYEHPATWLPIGSILKFLDKENQSPLHAAVDAGHVGVVEVLIKHGACPCAATGDQLPSSHLAVARGNLAMLQIFVKKYGGCILSAADKFHSFVLHKAAFSINAEPLVEFLLQNGCDPNQKDGEGSTLLHLAASIGNEKAV